MKKVDNRQKQQIQARAQKPHFGMPHGSHKEKPADHQTGFQEKEGTDSAAAAQEPILPVHRTEPKVGRNELCPCGSGKKYKKCCLDKADAKEGE